MNSDDKRAFQYVVSPTPQFLKLPNSIVNVDHIRKIEYDEQTAVVHWAMGAVSMFSGPDREALLLAIEQLQPLDFSAYGKPYEYVEPY